MFCGGNAAFGGIHSGQLNKMADEKNLVEDEAPENKVPANTVAVSITDLSTFKVDKVLYNNTKIKTVCLQGSFKDFSGIGIVLLEKSAFDERHIEQNSDLFTTKSSLVKEFHNDIYSNFKCIPTPEINPVKATIIHPATQKHIEKFSVQNSYIVEETPSIYYDIVLKHIEKDQFTLDWVYNILDHKSEVDRIVFEDPCEETGFILLPDLKWDGKTLENLYLLAIIRSRNTKSLRDISGSHIALLENIQKKGIKAIKEKYGLDSSQLRIYVHYQPSFYHFHVHFTYLKHEAPGIFTERSHMLTTVISNVKLLTNYYQEATLPFVVREQEKLFKTLENNNILKKIPPPN